MDEARNEVSERAKSNVVASSNAFHGSAASARSTDARALLATCVAAAVRAADVVRAAAETLREIHWEVKGPSDFVSRVDREAESVLAEIIAQRHPDAVLI